MTRFLFRAAAVAVSAGLFAVSIPGILAGFAVDAAFPAPVYLERNMSLSEGAYKAAARALAHATPTDGRAQIVRAELMLRAKIPVSEILPVLRTGLSHAPAHARGWAVFAEILSDSDRKSAARALALSIELAPRDYFLAYRRAAQGARLWDAFGEEGQETLLRQVRLLWTEASLRNDLYRLMGTPAGAGIVTHAFVRDPDNLRAINRWAAQRARAERRRAEALNGK